MISGGTMRCGIGQHRGRSVTPASSGSSSGGSDDFSPGDHDVQQWLSNGQCANGPAVCQTEYQALHRVHLRGVVHERTRPRVRFNLRAETPDDD